MGAWDDGLLDNDSAQDYIGTFASVVQQDIVLHGEASSVKIAGRLGASVGILLRLAYGFDPMPCLGDGPHFYPQLISAISYNFKHIVDLPGESPGLLSAVLQGRGEELASRPAELDKQVHACLFGGKQGFMQGAFSALETDLFTQRSASTYMAEKTKYLIGEIEAQLKSRNEVIDLSYTCFSGMMGLLLVLPHKGLKKKRIEKWRERCCGIWNSPGAEDEANDLDFETRYRRNVLAAFDCALLQC